MALGCAFLGRSAIRQCEFRGLFREKYNIKVVAVLGISQRRRCFGIDRGRFGR